MNAIVARDVSTFIEHFPFCREVANSTILITGATGLIGSTLVRCILGLNRQKRTEVKIIGLVRNIDKAKRLIEDDSVLWISYDLTDPIILKDINVDYVFHCACPTSSKFYIESPVELIKTSVQGSISILDFAKNNKVKGIVYLSSCEVYGSIIDDSEFLNENFSGYINPIDVRSGYPMSKRLVETLCHCYYKEYNVPVTIARLTQTFGAGVSLDDNRVFAQFSKSAIADENIELHTKGRSSKPYCYTIDAVIALFYLLIKGKHGEAYNIANEQSYISIKDLAEYIANTFSKHSTVSMVERNNMGYAPETKLRMCTNKLESLGWKPLYSLDNMFENLINYYKTQK